MISLWDNVSLALALVLIAEGLLPLLSPKMWRSTFEKLAQFNDGQLRFIGLALLITGSLMLAL